jgi:uncharacterized phage protein (TIGR01671 family)
MREIKFRAWNKGDKVMIYDLNYPRIKHGFLVHYENDVLMQYTGLRDKNGKDIYEGDIVRYENFGFDPSNGECPFEIGEILFYDYQWTIDKEWINEFEMEKLEVVGNIYENIELLEGDE